MSDRLFHSIDATYKSVMANPADVKELTRKFNIYSDFFV